MSGSNSPEPLSAMLARASKHLLDRIEKRGVTATELARSLGIEASQNVTNWKRRGMPANKLIQAAVHYGYSVDELLGQTTASAPKPGPAVPAALLDSLAELDADGRDDVIWYAQQRAQKARERSPRRRRKSPAA